MAVTRFDKKVLLGGLGGFAVQDLLEKLTSDL